MIWWNNVKPGYVVESDNELFIVTELSIRMDDVQHLFNVVRLFCLTNDDISGMTVMTAANVPDHKYIVAWKPE